MGATRDANDLKNCRKEQDKPDPGCTDSYKYRTKIPSHKKDGFPYCYNKHACSLSDKCRELENNSGKGKCKYISYDPKKAFNKAFTDDMPQWFRLYSHGLGEFYWNYTRPNGRLINKMNQYTNINMSTFNDISKEFRTGNWAIEIEGKFYEIIGRSNLYKENDAKNKSRIGYIDFNVDKKVTKTYNNDGGNKTGKVTLYTKRPVLKKKNYKAEF